jgi:hypothetical protein
MAETDNKMVLVVRPGALHHRRRRPPGTAILERHHRFHRSRFDRLAEGHHAGWAATPQTLLHRPLADAPDGSFPWDADYLH